MKDFTGTFHDTTFCFDGTEEGFISVAVMAGLRTFGVGEDRGGFAYLNDGHGAPTLITVYYHPWGGKLVAAATVSNEPLSELLDRIKRESP